MKRGGNIYDQVFSRGVWGHAPKNFLGCFRALRQLLMQSEAKIMIELLNICFIDDTNLVLWLTYCMKTSFRVQACPKSGGGGGGGGSCPPAPPPPSPTPVNSYN